MTLRPPGAPGGPAFHLLLTFVSPRVYTARPKRGISARVAWNILSEHAARPLRWMRLVEGYWMCEREDGTNADADALVVLFARNNHAPDHPDNA